MFVAFMGEYFEGWYPKSSGMYEKRISIDNPTKKDMKRILRVIF